MKIRPLTLTEVEYVAFRLARELMAWNEPIPDFGSRFPHVLESCLKLPFQTFSRRNLYRGLVKKASILFYLLIKNHPFQNGNKRIAVTTLLVFLEKNGKWLELDSTELYSFAKRIAASNPKQKDAVLLSIQKFISAYLTDR